ncbi:MAG: Plug domain-containing protein [Niabella sp.]
MKRDGNVLEEIIVVSKVKIQGSKNLNDDGGSDQVITEKTLEKTPKASLLEVLGKQIPGFPMVRGVPFAIGKSKIEIVIDGLHLGWFEMDPIDVLQYYSAEDAKGIEVMKSLKYNMAYQMEFYDPMKISFMEPPIFIEITTKTGEGPFMKKKPGFYLYKPLVPVIAKQFYSPRYSSPDEETVFPDLRPTIYWEPNVITDKKGEAHVSFYTSESKGSYLVIVQGTDLAGRFGVSYQFVNVKRK